MWFADITLFTVIIQVIIVAADVVTFRHTLVISIHNSRRLITYAAPTRFSSRAIPAGFASVLTRAFQTSPLAP
jgi:hypothetical protein